MESTKEPDTLIFDNVTRAASVTLTEAMSHDPQSGKYVSFQAKDYNPEEHSHLQFFCKHCFDDGKKISLSKPTSGYEQNIHFKLTDPESGNEIIDPATQRPIFETERYYFPPHFITLPNQKHDCTAAHQHEKLTDFLERVTHSAKDETTICSVNIDCGQPLPKERTRPDAFSDVARHRQMVRGPSRARSITDLEQLAQILDHTSVDAGKREHIILQMGRARTTLAALYHDNAAHMLNALQTKIQPVLFALQLDSHKKPEWHFPKNKPPYLAVHSESALHDGDGRKITVKIAFDDPIAELAVKAITDRPDGPLDFLVYAEHVEVKPEQNQIKLIVRSGHQIGRWSPEPQIDHKPPFNIIPDDTSHPDIRPS